MAQVKAVPEGSHTVTPVLVVDGAAEAIEFYKRSFGAVEVQRAPDPSGQKIWHATFRIGDSLLFISDAMPNMGGASKAKLWLYLDKVDAAWKRATDAGAQVKMPIGDMFWGDRMGMLADRWGNEWTLAQHIKDLTPEEMKKAQDDFIAQMKKK